MEEQKSYWGVIPGEVFHDQELTAAAKLLYLVLSTMAHRNGYCWRRSSRKRSMSSTDGWTIPIRKNCS